MIFASELIIRVLGLKSDQNGIEIRTDIIVIWYPFLLKSDQNGIEIADELDYQIGSYTIKIRPKWD